MKFVLAPDSMKGSLSAVRVCAAMDEGIRQVAAAAGAEILSLPLADGGEGTLEAIRTSCGGELQPVTVTGPQGLPVPACWLRLPSGQAVIEMAQASGFMLVQQPATAGQATSYGTGELIRHALISGCRDLQIGIGGSATTDGGTGALRALGIRFLDGHGQELPPGGSALSQLDQIDLSGVCPSVREARVTVWCDVDNPLCGPCGAARVFAPQKGATPEEVEELEAGLDRLANVSARVLGSDFRDHPGAGAAGGIGFGLLAFLGAEVQSGSEAIGLLIGLPEKLAGADLVLTAEGKLDRQTLGGKTVAGLCRFARAAEVPVIALAGQVDLDFQQQHELGLAAAFPLCSGPMDLQASLDQAPSLLAQTAARVIALFLLRSGAGST